MIQPGESDWDEELLKSLSRPTDQAETVGSIEIQTEHKGSF